MFHHLRLPIVAGLLAASAPVVAEPNAWNDWVRDNSPFGKVISKDGTIWINLDEIGLPDDYAVRAGDLRNARETRDRNPRFWIIGSHVNNRDVEYRETKKLYQLDCNAERLKGILFASYGPSGNLLSQQGEDASYSIIIPGTYGAEFYRLFCVVPR